MKWQRESQQGLVIARTRYHKMKLVNCQIKMNQGKVFSTQHAVHIWNSWPPDVVEADSVARDWTHAWRKGASVTIEQE